VFQCDIPLGDIVVVGGAVKVTRLHWKTGCSTMNLFATKRYRDAPPAQQARLNDAYIEGRREERSKLADRQHTHVEVKHAYERGRRDERARRRGSPLLMFVLLVAAAAGAAAIALAVHEGSFARGGQVVDQSLSNATATVASKTADTLQNAGANLKPAPTPAPAAPKAGQS
jgi:hypothetical protein